MSGRLRGSYPIVVALALLGLCPDLGTSQLGQRFVQRNLFLGLPRPSSPARCSWRWRRASRSSWSVGSCRAGHRADADRGPGQPRALPDRGGTGLVPPAAALLGFGAGATVTPCLLLAGLGVHPHLLGRAFALAQLLRLTTTFAVAPIVVYLAGSHRSPAAGIHPRELGEPRLARGRRARHRLPAAGAQVRGRVPRSAGA